jgi:hypothetical protein
MDIKRGKRRNTTKKTRNYHEENSPGVVSGEGIIS